MMRFEHAKVAPGADASEDEKEYARWHEMVELCGDLLGGVALMMAAGRTEEIDEIPVQAAVYLLEATASTLRLPDDRLRVAKMFKARFDALVVELEGEKPADVD